MVSGQGGVGAVITIMSSQILGVQRKLESDGEGVFIPN